MTYEEALAAMRQAFAADLRARRRYYRPRGLNWTQITPAEQEVFQIPPHEVPRLVTLHQYCMAFHKADDDDEPFRDIGPTAFVGSPAYKIIKRRLSRTIDFKPKVASVETFEELGRLFGVPAGLAHAWWHKDELWQIREGFGPVFDSPPVPANEPEDDEIPF
jgi:hypothetical protein